MNAFKTIEKQVLLEVKDYMLLDSIVHVDEPFTVTCSDDELSQAEIRYWIDDNVMTIQFRLNDYIVSKCYEVSQKKMFCFLRWCL